MLMPQVFSCVIMWLSGSFVMPHLIARFCLGGLWMVKPCQMRFGLCLVVTPEWLGDGHRCTFPSDTLIHATQGSCAPLNGGWCWQG
ncbi:hypothetical protein COO60DRAFT_1540220 [Scenedesmus sp. NREL 46B-D3]|nr:hypothetical protein COO60DRAFT_1540220 [Scenedesmus sp. NREL 46B-D3]